MWRLIDDLEGYPRWWPIWEMGRWTGPTSGEGRRGRLRARRFVYTLDADIEVVRFEQGREVEIRITGELEGRAGWRLRALPGDRTHVTWSISAAPRKVLLPLPPAVARPLYRLIHQDDVRTAIRGMRRELEAPRPGGLIAYEFREQWYVPAPPEAVWPIIREVARYPQWWGEFASATRLNDLDGVGAIVAVGVRSALPYRMSFEVEAVRETAPQLAEARVRGDLNGLMRWTLVPENGGTRLFFEEEVTTGKPVLNLLAPLFKPAFAWNHEIMMKHGEQALRRLVAGLPPQAAATGVARRRLARWAAAAALAILLLRRFRRRGPRA